MRPDQARRLAAAHRELAAAYEEIAGAGEGDPRRLPATAAAAPLAPAPARRRTVVLKPPSVPVSDLAQKRARRDLERAGLRRIGDGTSDPRKR